MRVFRVVAPTVNIDVSSSSQRVAFAPLSDEIRIMNNGTATAWINFGDSTVTAALTTSVPIGPGVVEVYNLPIGATHFAAIAAGATGKIYATPGIGA